MDKLKLLKGMLVFFSIILVFTLGHWSSSYYPSTIGRISYYENCSNLSLDDTSYCLKTELSKWYKYNISNIGKDLSIEELKERGGVCSH